MSTPDLGMTICDHIKDLTYNSQSVVTHGDVETKIMTHLIDENEEV